MARVQVGNVEIVALSDGSGAYAGDRVYPSAGEALQRYAHHLDAEGRVPLNFGCFLLRADGRTVLVDTGNGPEADGTLMAQLSEAGVQPGDIDTVVVTHLHGDHFGGLEELAARIPVGANPKGLALSPDGRWLLLLESPKVEWREYPLDGGPSRPLPFGRLGPGEYPLVWSNDGRWLYCRVKDPASGGWPRLPMVVIRIDTRTGQRQPWLQTSKPDLRMASAAGLLRSSARAQPNTVIGRPRSWKARIRRQKPARLPNSNMLSPARSRPLRPTDELVDSVRPVSV